MHPIKHFRTVNKHRRLVRKYCFRLGLYRQGLVHDLSKYSPSEFWNGARYYTGDHSPVSRERKAKGFSSAWLHHKGRNKHHPEYWMEYMIYPDGSVGYGANKMPLKYIAEMFCDMIAASRVYLGEEYTDRAPYDRFNMEREFKQMHPETVEIFEKMLEVLKDEGEEVAFRYVRKLLKSKE